MSVSAPFVWRCLSGSTVTPVSTPRSIEPDMQISRIRLSDKISRLHSRSETGQTYQSIVLV